MAYLIIIPLAIIWLACVWAGDFNREHLQSDWDILLQEKDDESNMPRH